MDSGLSSLRVRSPVLPRNESIHKDHETLTSPPLQTGGATPWDTYTFSSQLLTEWSIDGTILRFPNKNYYVYSCIRDTLQSLCIAPMNSPSSLGPATLLTKPTQSWETQGDFAVAEGPAALYHGGKTYIAYSGSQCWSPSYQLGLLTYKGSGDPTAAGSWTKSGPVFSSANGNYGTGHNGYACCAASPLDLIDSDGT